MYHGVAFLPVETEDFSENQNQDHAHEYPGLLHVRADALVSHDSDGVSGSQTSHAHRYATGKVHEAVEQTVAGGARGRHIFGDQDGDDKRVDGNDTGHDDGDEALQRGGLVGFRRWQGGGGGDSFTFMIRSGR
jgi:hypothetical protein